MTEYILSKWKVRVGDYVLIENDLSFFDVISTEGMLLNTIACELLKERGDSLILPVYNLSPDNCYPNRSSILSGGGEREDILVNFKVIPTTIYDELGELGIGNIF